jgi:tRNA A-37 threonylcarbamoyl transferase component Bud32
LEKNSFTILEIIRDGHSTRVLKAEQPSLKRIVLLKTLHKHLITDTNLVRRFEREARACAMIRSEHIVQVHDLVELDGAPAIVMEYVEGKSLQELLREAVQSEQFARMVAASVLTALSVAHRAGVIHRDIKPSNIMIDRHGVVKVADFGLASVGVETTLTLEGTVLGTPAYMSPEQVSGGVIDGRSDLFSLGVTIIELVTGEKLFQGESYAECLNKILNFNIESLDRFSGTMSDSFLTFVRRLMMPRKEDRFASAADALKELTGNEPGSPVRMAERGAKSRKLATAVAATIIILAIISILYFWPRSKGEGGVEGNKHPVVTMADSARADTISRIASRGVLGGSNAPRDTQRTRHVQIPTEKTNRELQTVDGLHGPTKEATAEKAIADSGYVQISCTPWAKVFLGNEYIGTTPIAGSLKVKAGVHTITFNNPSFLPIVRSVTVRPGTQTPVDANFLDEVGYLLVVSQPWAQIYVDDQYRETTPIAQPLMVSSGNRKIRLHNPSFEDIVTTIAIRARDTVKLVKSFTMK